MIQQYILYLVLAVRIQTWKKLYFHFFPFSDPLSTETFTLFPLFVYISRAIVIGRHSGREGVTPKTKGTNCLSCVREATLSGEEWGYLHCQLPAYQLIFNKYFCIFLHWILVCIKSQQQRENLNPAITDSKSHALSSVPPCYFSHHTAHQGKFNKTSIKSWI